MEEFINIILSTPALALIISVVIFIVTLILVIKRLIGFFITLLLLFFTIISGYAILNHDLIRSFLTTYYHEQKVDRENDKNFKKNLLEAYEDLKEKMECFLNNKDEKKE